MKEVLKVLALASVLAAATAGLGWLGLEWDGETDSSSWYALLGLPFLAGLIALPELGVPAPAALAAGFLAQLLCCLFIVGVPWAVWRACCGAPRERTDDHANAD